MNNGRRVVDCPECGGSGTVWDEELWIAETDGGQGGEEMGDVDCPTCGGTGRVVGVRKGVHTLITADGRVMEFDAMTARQARAGLWPGGEGSRAEVSYRSMCISVVEKACQEWPAEVLRLVWEVVKPKGA